ncbi:MAG: nucleotidyltransferase family protein [Anaerolineae bacterium]|nr:nucleotidyltransferase family protein [Anaerolineae bacterium]
MNIVIDLPLDAIRDFCARHPIKRLSVFGSVLRDDFSGDSDIDILVEFDKSVPVTFFDLVDMRDQLAELLGREVDLLTPGFLSPHMQQRVLKTAQVLYVHGVDDQQS